MYFRNSIDGGTIANRKRNLINDKCPWYYEWYIFYYDLEHFAVDVCKQIEACSNENAALTSQKEVEERTRRVRNQV